MKLYLLFIPLAAIVLTSCDAAHRINQSTCDIQHNTDAIESSTDAINRNLEELEKVREARS